MPYFYAIGPYLLTHNAYYFCTGGLFIVTVVGISCVSCYLCTKRKLQHRRPSPRAQPPDGSSRSYILFIFTICSSEFAEVSLMTNVNL